MTYDRYAWNFAQMPIEGSLKEFRKKSKAVCQMTYAEARKYRKSLNATLYKLNGDNAETDTLMPYYCFLSAYSLLLLQGWLRVRNVEHRRIDISRPAIG